MSSDVATSLLGETVAPGWEPLVSIALQQPRGPQYCWRSHSAPAQLPSHWPGYSDLYLLFRPSDLQLLSASLLPADSLHKEIEAIRFPFSCTTEQLYFSLCLALRDDAPLGGVRPSRTALKQCSCSSICILPPPQPPLSPWQNMRSFSPV